MFSFPYTVKGMNLSSALQKRDRESGISGFWLASRSPSIPGLTGSPDIETSPGGAVHLWKT